MVYEGSEIIFRDSFEAKERVFVFHYQYMLGSPFSTNRAKAVLKSSLAPPTNNASLLFWLVQFLAAKQIIGGDNLPCGFLVPSVGFWRNFQHVLQYISKLFEINVIFCGSFFQQRKKNRIKNRKINYWRYREYWNKLVQADWWTRLIVLTFELPHNRDPFRPKLVYRHAWTADSSK